MVVHWRMSPHAHRDQYRTATTPVNAHAAIEQQTGEDWTGVDMTLSTAQPQLNATPPELFALDITVVGRARAAIAGSRQGSGRRDGAVMGGSGMGGMGGPMGS